MLSRVKREKGELNKRRQKLRMLLAKKVREKKGGEFLLAGGRNQWPNQRKNGTPHKQMRKTQQKLTKTFKF